jgi:hypothetical protein
MSRQDEFIDSVSRELIDPLRRNLRAVLTENDEIKLLDVMDRVGRQNVLIRIADEMVTTAILNHEDPKTVAAILHAAMALTSTVERMQKIDWD